MQGNPLVTLIAFLSGGSKPRSIIGKECAVLRKARGAHPRRAPRSIPDTPIHCDSRWSEHAPLDSLSDTHTHTHTHTLESNPGKTRKNATLENVGPTEITEACRQTAGAPTRGIRLQISQHLTRRKIGIAHASAPRTHAHARCPAAIPAQHGTAPAAAGTGPTPAIRGKGGRDGRRGPVRQRFRTRVQPREKTTKCRGPTENNKNIAERRPRNLTAWPRGRQEKMKMEGKAPSRPRCAAKGKRPDHPPVPAPKRSRLHRGRSAREAVSPPI